MLGIEELNELEQNIMEELQDSLLGILSKLNRAGELENALAVWGLDHLLVSEKEYEVYKTGKIVVVGQSDVQKDVLLAIAAKAGIEKSRLELHLDYNDAKTMNFRKYQWDPSYSVILVGPMPHSGKEKGDAGSVISAIEETEGYPPVVRMGTTKLKITKSDFRSKIDELIQRGIIAF